MTGPEHYREAERLIAGPTFSTERRGAVPSADPAAIAAAQVHAMLAQVAATADLFALYGQVGDESKEAWRKAIAS